MVADGGVIVVYAWTFDAVTPPPLTASNASIAFMLIYKIPQTAKLASVFVASCAYGEQGRSVRAWLPLLRSHQYVRTQNGP